MFKAKLIKHLSTQKHNKTIYQSLLKQKIPKTSFGTFKSKSSKSNPLVFGSFRIMSNHRLVLLLDKTFQTRKNTVYRVTSSLMSELPQLTLAEARTKAEHARDLGTQKKRHKKPQKTSQKHFFVVGFLFEMLFWTI